MAKNGSRNTYQKSTVRYVVFLDKEDKAWYAAGLEFNIVESGDDPLEALSRLYDAAKGYVKSAARAKLPLEAINQKPAEEYRKMWYELMEHETRKSYENAMRQYAFGGKLLTLGHA